MVGVDGMGDKTARVEGHIRSKKNDDAGSHSE
jgi:hypothetical protein